jgi:hypothetical protein
MAHRLLNSLGTMHMMNMFGLKGSGKGTGWQRDLGADLCVRSNSILVGMAGTAGAGLESDRDSDS